MKADIGSLMKQAQKMQAEMQKAQDELANLEVSGEAGAGLVKIRMTCKHEVRALTIDPALLGDDREMLEDVLIAAFNDALRKVERTVQDKMGGVTAGMTAGMGLPPGLKLPF
ncbi:MAG: YbaB/EbfC family nucleoid-associated protein [Gammaproteobacteria bacterium]